MAETQVKMPQMGESIFEGTVTKWLKKKGDKVQRDEPLFEISTDKIDTEIPSPASGVLQDILVKEGQTVQINTTVAIIGDGAAKPAEGKPETQEPPPAQAKQQPSRPSGPPPVAGPAPTTGGEKDEAEEGEHEHIRSSPLVRRIAKEHGIDLASLSGKGTGTNGRVTKRDILGYIEPGAPAAPPLKPVGTPKEAPPASPPMKFTGEVERVPMTAMRKAIAEHMIMSRRTSAHVTTLFEVDCSRILKAKEKQQAELERSGVKLTVTPFFVQAAATALKRFPIVNSSLEGDTIVYKQAINIGIAVTLESGLIVPVIKHADDRNLSGIAKAIHYIGDRAR